MLNIPTIDHELRSLTPPLLSEEREQLEQNILESRKCHDPIITWDGVILDGHNRFEICVKHGIEFQIDEISLPSKEAAKVWILDNQLSRRNLNDAARIEMALLKAEMLREKAKKNLSLAGGDKKSKKSPLSVVSKPEFEYVNVRKAIAADAGVGEEKLYNYLQIKKHGSPDLQTKVKSGQLKIGTAHRLLTKEILKQLTQADKMIKFIKDANPPEGYATKAPKIHAELVNLESILSALVEKLGGTHETA